MIESNIPIGSTIEQVFHKSTKLKKPSYYSLKTDDKEYTVEPLLYGDFYLAEYDLDKNLVRKKQIFKESEVRERMAEIEKALNKKFVVEYI